MAVWNRPHGSVNISPSVDMSVRRSPPSAGGDRGSERGESGRSPGTSKWNKIAHRLWSMVTLNRRGRPLVSHEVVVELIGATTSRSGLSVRAELDRGSYPKGIEISDDQLAAAGVKKHDFHGEWNYDLRPSR